MRSGAENFILKFFLAVLFPMTCQVSTVLNSSGMKRNEIQTSYRLIYSRLRSYILHIYIYTELLCILHTYFYHIV